MSFHKPTRHQFLGGAAAAIGVSALLNSTVLAALDTNSLGGRIFHAGDL